MSNRKVATTVYITSDQDRKLKLLSQASDVSMAQYIREGIDLVLRQYKDRIPQQLGLGFSEAEDGP